MTSGDFTRIMSPVQRILRRLYSRLSPIDGFDRAAMLLVATLVILVFLTFDDYAVSNDEGVQQRYGQLIISYYLSGFTDQSVFHFQNLYLYGGLFDIVAALLEQVLPVELYTIRHVLCALSGVGGIVATWAVARLIAGPRAAVLALAVLAVCGPWYGAMFNHTKDIPFAAAMMGATYFLLRATRDLPRVRYRDILLFGLLLGISLSLRATGLLMLGYAGLAILLGGLKHAAWRERIHYVGHSLLRFLPAFVLAYVIMIVAWPWASLAPLNPVRAIFAFAHFHYMINTLAFGTIYQMAEVPRWYVPLYLAIKLPLTMLVGATLAILAAAWPSKGQSLMRSEQRRQLAVLAFMIIFPVLCHVISRGPAFTGMRHFIFVVPPLAALAGLGFDAALSFLAGRRRSLAVPALAALGAVLVWNAATSVRLHPYQYLFYNSLVGGLESATRQFDTDYWVNIMPEAVDDLQAFLDRTDTSHSARPGVHYSVAVCGERLSFENEADKDSRLAWTGDWDNADFFIAPTHMNCDRALDGVVIATIERMGAPIGVVKDRRTISRPGLARHR